MAPLMTTYRVRVRGTVTDSENRIHDDATAAPFSKCATRPSTARDLYKGAGHLATADSDALLDAVRNAPV
jgi:hypothetical protein